MAQFERWFSQDLNKGLIAHFCPDIVFTEDNNPAVIGVRLFDGDEPAPQTGATCLCYCIRADGNTVQFTGTVSGNEVSATLPKSCFYAVGSLAIMLQTVTGTGNSAVSTTVLKLVVNVEPSKTGSSIDPGNVVPNLSTLLAMLDQMEAATEAANEAAAKSVRYFTTQSVTAAQKTRARANIDAADISLLAPTFSASGDYYIGDLVVYQGNLFRCTASHEHTAWNSSHFTAVTMDGEINAKGWNWAQLTAYYNTHGIQKVAFPFLASYSYQVGDYATYAGGLYRNKTGTAGTDPSSDTTNWDYIPPVRMPDVTAVSDALDDVRDGIAPTFSASTAYAAGQSVWYNGGLYRFTQAHAAGAWDSTHVAAEVVASHLWAAADDGNGNITITGG